MGTVSTVAEAFGTPPFRPVYRNTVIAPFAAQSGSSAQTIKAGMPVVLTGQMEVGLACSANSSFTQLVGIAASNFTPGQASYGNTDISVYMPEPTSFYRIDKSLLDPSGTYTNNGSLTPLFVWESGGWTSESGNAAPGLGSQLAYCINSYPDGSILVMIGANIGSW
ncbi:MAG: hypothetical protein IIY17_00940 [Aeriscardovia sp.]|nr:hypothetical protein [Aeriscardovia sp.]